MYQSLEASLHDVFWQVEAPDYELERIQQHLDSFPGKSLEIGCGSGRILLPLNANGYPTDGNDISFDMLKRIKKCPPEVKLHQGTTLTQEISEYRHFLVPAFTFMLMSEQELAETLSYIHQHAPTNAQLYCTLFIPWAEICGELEEEEWFEDHKAEHEDGRKAVCETQFTLDRTNQILTRKHRYSVKKKNQATKKHQSTQILRWYYYKEMQTLLQHHGWKIARAEFDFDPDSNGENAHIYSLFCEKI